MLNAPINLDKLENIAIEQSFGIDVLTYAIELVTEARAANDDWLDTLGEYELLQFCDDMINGRC